MRTSFTNRPAIAFEGQRHGVDYKTVPLTLASLEQITTITIADSEAGDWSISVTDRLTGQVFGPVVVEVSGATEATTLDEFVAGWQNSPLRNLAVPTEDGVDTATLTFRNVDREYIVETTPPGSMTATVANSQDAGGAGVELGRFVRRVGDDRFEALLATSTLADVAGLLARTDGNHFHSLENDGPDAVDRVLRGKTYPIDHWGWYYLRTETAVTPASPVYIRRAQTSSAGVVGRVRGAAAGGAQVYTLTPTAADGLHHGFEFDYLGQHYVVSRSDASDSTATVTEICDDLRTAAGTIAGLTFGGTATLTITTAAGTAIENVRSTGNGAFASIIESTPADVDTIDARSIAAFESSAGAGELVLVRLFRGAQA